MTIFKHGVNGYNNHKCRCEICRTAKHQYLKTPIAIINKKNADERWRNSDSGKKYASNYYSQYGHNPEVVNRKAISNAQRYANPIIKSKIIERQRRYRNNPEFRFNMYKKAAQKRGYTFELNFEQFLSFWGKPCFYCGAQIDSIGLDRKDNKIGYNINNVVPCCATHNRMKSDMTLKEFVVACQAVVDCFKDIKEAL